MADSDAAESPGRDHPAQPMTVAATDSAESRGTLVVKERAVSRVAVAAALAVPGVARQSSGMSRFTGRDLPRADVSVGDHSVSVNLYVVLGWPCRISDVASTIHAEVGRALETMVGLPLHQLNILVSATTPTEEPEPPVEADPERPVLHPRPPAASPAALPVALVGALALLGIAFVAGREFLITHDTVDGAPWIANSVDWIARLHWSSWMIAAAGAAVVLGLISIAVGLKPRTRTHTGASTPAATMPTVWLRPTDVARLCSDHAGTVPGSESARTTVTKRTVTVDVHRAPDSDGAALAESVREAITPTLAVLTEARRVRVRVKDGRT